MDGLSCLLIALAFFQNDRSWDPQAHFAVDTAAFITRCGVTLLGIALHGRDFVSQKARGFAPCVRDERFFFRELETELFSETRSLLAA